MRPAPGASLLLLASGFGIWAAAFVALYAMLTVGCAFGWDRMELAFGVTLQRLQLLGLSAIVLAAHAALLFRMTRPPYRSAAARTTAFVRTTALAAAAAALGASVFTYMGVVALTACAP